MSAATKIAKTPGASGGGETVIKGRRGTLYNVNTEGGPVMDLGELRARRRFAASRYFLSPAGVIKIVVLVSLESHAVSYTGTDPDEDF